MGLIEGTFLGETTPPPPPQKTQYPFLYLTNTQ